MKKNESKKDGEGAFVGFILLKDNSWDVKKIIKDLKKDWGIEVKETDENESAILFNIGESMAAISLMPAPVPNNEAEENAANNYRWKEAVEVTKTHEAHLLVAVLGKDTPIIERGKVYTKVCSSCLKQKNALGIYTSGTVFEPKLYIEAAEVMEEGELPILAWIYFGLYKTEKGMSAYTFGMNIFGKDEIEVLDTDEEASNLFGFLFDIVNYVLTSDVVLQDGETIGFSEEQKLKITKSKGVSLDGDTLKITYE